MALLSKGRDLVNVVDGEQRTPLHHASIGGHLRIVKQLINSKADSNSISKQKLTPLHCASLMGHLEVVKLLVENGAKVNMKDGSGYSTIVFSLTELDIPLLCGQ